MTQVSRRLPATGLAACLLGFVFCPVPFVVLAARAELQPIAAAVIAAAFVLRAGFLPARLLGKTRSGTSMRLLLELASWVTIAALLLFISQMHLMRGVERWGTISLIFLGASALCFPLVWVRRTALEQRLTRLPRTIVITALCALLTLSGTMLYAYVTTPARAL